MDESKTNAVSFPESAQSSGKRSYSEMASNMSAGNGDEIILSLKMIVSPDEMRALQINSDNPMIIKLCHSIML